MLWLYRLLFVPVLLLASPYYLLRMRRRGGYARHFGQRFGAWAPIPPKRAGVRRIWLQAVSVGEMLAIGPLLDAFKDDSTVEFVITTTTSTGFQLAHDRYREKTVAIGYFPVDWWFFSRRAWRKIAPDLMLLVEGERWPEHLHQAESRGVPVLCVNARLSDRSFKRMTRWHWTVRPLFHGVTRILACSELDAERFRALGIPAEKIVTTGSIKLDLTIPLLASAERAKLRLELGVGDDPLLLGSSTWPGEEGALVNAFKELRAAGVIVRLLLVPRHAERRDDIEAELKKSGVTYHFRSRGAAPQEVDVAVADTTGELRKLTQLAEVVFVGKSLPPHTEGQTPVEAAALGKPLLFGPGMSNFRVIAKDLRAVKAAEVVPTVAALTGAVSRLFREPSARTSMALAAQAWHRANQGAVKRTAEIIAVELARLG